MSDLRLNAAAALAIVRRDWQVLISYRMPFVASMLSGFFSLTLFYYISRLVKFDSFGSPDQYFAYAVIGLIILQVLNSAFMSLPGGVRGELMAGTFERLVVSPFGGVASIASMLLFPLVYSTLMAVAMLAFATLAFSLPVHWSTAPLMLPLAFLGAASFAPFGLFIAATVLVAKQAVAGTTWIVAGISLIAGLYFPVTLLPGWIQWASQVQPFTPAVELMRNVLVGTPLTGPAWTGVLKMVAYGVLLVPVSIWALGAALKVSQRRGTVIEY
jgi:ABC-2 type transport system permease protein